MNTLLRKIDWITILCYFTLVFIGWLNIYSATLVAENSGIFNLDKPYGKQLLFILFSVALIIVILAIEAKFYERFSSLIYLISLASLIGLFFFGKTISGATSWYALGNFTLQPAEFAKAATALALAKYLSDIQTDIKNITHQLSAFLIIVIPALLIIPQPDPGSALIFSSFFFVLYREGISKLYLFIILSILLLFVSTLLFNPFWVAVGVFLVLMSYFFIKKRKKKRIKRSPLLLIFILAIGFSFIVPKVFNDVFEQRHRDRFNLWLRLEKDPEKLSAIRKTIGYNTHQSETTIGSGGFFGKGFLEGTRTKGNFVPEQHTDYIFSTVGEEWGFIGSVIVIILFCFLLLRLLMLAERQKSKFSRIFGYGVVSILFIHVVINMGMVLGLLPTIGIPLPFFSYGGSSLWGFTILLFIFLKLDANRIHDWMNQ